MQPLYPLRFEPIFLYRLWGGRRLADFFGRSLPDDGPIGEAWVLSDRDDHPSRVLAGRLAGTPLPELVQRFGRRLLGAAADQHRRFPLLLKFLDARETLSVQVHPADHHTHLLPAGERGKTEAWVVLDAASESRVYVGLRPGTRRDDLHRSLRDQTVEEHLASFTPQVGDCLFLPAGVVHALGGGVVLFEVQQNSDVTFRLHDWGRRDPKTGLGRELHIEQALACTDFAHLSHGPVVPHPEQTAPVHRERLVACAYFQLWRWHGRLPFTVGAAGVCRVVVCVAGSAQLAYGGEEHPLRPGDVVLLAAELGPCLCQPTEDVTILECGLADEGTATAEVGEFD
jgi:mannose-6-phosphate isomerase